MSNKKRKSNATDDSMLQNNQPTLWQIEVIDKINELKQLDPNAVIDESVPEDRDSAIAMVSKLSKAIGRAERQKRLKENEFLNFGAERLDAALKAYQELADRHTAAELELQQQNAELRETLSKVNEELAKNNGRGNEKNFTSLIGRIQLEKLDDSTGGASMSKEDAIIKWPRWKANVNTIRDEKSIQPTFRHAYLCDRGGNIVKEIDKWVTLQEADATGDPFEDLVKKIDNYLKKDPALIMCARREFSNARQKANENVDEYVIRLNKAADSCDWNIVERDGRLRDQFISGCKHRRIVLQCSTSQENIPVSLEVIASKARIEEAAIREEALMSAELDQPRAIVAVHAVEARQNRRSQADDGWPSRPSTSGYQSNLNNYVHRKRDAQGRPKLCSGCGSSWHEVKTDCPAYNDTCDFCHKPSHWIQVCRQRAKEYDRAPFKPQTVLQRTRMRTNDADDKDKPRSHIHETSTEDDLRGNAKV